MPPNIWFGIDEKPKIVSDFTYVYLPGHCPFMCFHQLPKPGLNCFSAVVDVAARCGRQKFGYAA